MPPFQFQHLSALGERILRIVEYSFEPFRRRAGVVVRVEPDGLPADPCVRVLTCRVVEPYPEVAYANRGHLSELGAYHIVSDVGCCAAGHYDLDFDIRYVRPRHPVEPFLNVHHGMIPSPSFGNLTHIVHFATIVLFLTILPITVPAPGTESLKSPHRNMA